MSTLLNRPNIAVVAKEAGVAKSTVSRVLNGGSASAQVRARVSAVIKKLGYTPTPTARNLALGQAGSLGLVVETSQGAWFMQILGGVEEELANRRISLLLSSTVLTGKYDPRTVAGWINERRVDALILCRPTKRDRELVEAARQSRIPMSLIAPDEEFGQGHVLRSQNREGAREVGDHLWSLGHRRFAFVGGPKESVDTRDRLLGVEDALAKWGARIPAAQIRYAPSYTDEGGRDYAQAWLKLPRDKAPTAVVFGNDTLALGFMAIVQQHGIRVPRDVSAVGFDDVPESALIWPGLTTSRQEARAMAASACRSVLARLENPSARPAPIEFPMTLVVRQSTGPPPNR
jgi:DNA-binding LacI/PurR family transcriptional regulator